MLKISTDGRKAALDMRLVTGEPVGGDRASSTSSPTRSPRSGHSTATLTYIDPETGCHVADTGGAADRVLRPRHPARGSLERLPRAPLPAGRSRDPGAASPVHPRSGQRPGEGPAVSRLPRRAGRGAHRLDREDGSRHQHPSSRRRASPHRLRLAAGGHRAARRTDRPPRQPEPRSQGDPLRRRRLL